MVAALKKLPIFLLMYYSRRSKIDWRLDKSDDLWRFIVKAPKICLLCGETNKILLEAHHIFYGSKKSIIEIRLNPLCGCCLCIKCHLYKYYAPHVDNKKFLALLEQHLLQKNPEKLKFINQIRNTPDSELGGKVELKLIYLDLQNQAKQIERTDWMDFDLEPEYRGRPYKE